MKPGSLRVVAGRRRANKSPIPEIVFRLEGKTGERVVFAFKKPVAALGGESICTAKSFRYEPMMRRGAGLSLALSRVRCASRRTCKGVVIDHRAVGCIVVGKYPKMNACFSPAADLARSRVYFRPEGVDELVLRRHEGATSPASPARCPSRARS